MYKKIVVALSLEHGVAESALQAAAKLADENAEIFAVHVNEPLQGSVRYYVSDEDLAKARAQAEAALDKRLESYPDVKAVLLEGHPGRTITDHASEIGCDCIVIGSHKPGLADYLLGSTAARIVQHAPCAVHVLR